MQVQRLSWAGIKITAGSTSLLVDAFADPDSAVGFIAACQQRSVKHTILETGKVLEW